MLKRTAVTPSQGLKTYNALNFRTPAARSGMGLCRGFQDVLYRLSMPLAALLRGDAISVECVGQAMVAEPLGA